MASIEMPKSVILQVKFEFFCSVTFPSVGQVQEHQIPDVPLP